ncbi:NnrS family protein [Motilimonas sp. 1_MG-2023]|uniref:NnrS family protein n=1 Tax=Motilimonas sp. 1_MG-2023 TaxID=3062672 RepID=UPI0026E38546|nr:NnrS family protein [Motilimonas sp. 1_MG-2023]MDO6524785.1 NnrS family protein [Motilimonas sp. 1_MG-2023]
MLNIVDRAKEDRVLPIFRLGFRPFFLFASLYAILCIPVWLWLRSHGQPDLLVVPALWWHVHELLFGFAMAIVMGFVLTAVQNWTGIRGTHSWALAGLFSLWLLPRLLFWTPTPLIIILIIESLFILSCAIAVAKRVIKMKRWKNLFFVPLLLLALVVNALSYISINGQPILGLQLSFTSSALWQSMIWWFALLLSIMGARVIPFFTATKLGIDKPRSFFWLESAANIPFIVLFILSFIPSLNALWSPPLFVFAATFQFIRLYRWQGLKTLHEPLLWSLHLGYAFIPLSLLVLGLNLFPGFWHVSLHLIAIGSIAGVILAMITRVTMGHTGRNIYQGPNMTWAFLAIASAALVRTFAVLLWPQWMNELLWLAGGLWCFAFAIFTLKFGPMLVQPRVDDHPG